MNFYTVLFVPAVLFTFVWSDGTFLYSEEGVRYAPCAIF